MAGSNLSLYHFGRRVWRGVPAPVRKTPFMRRIRGLLQQQVAAHDDIYNPAYYAERRGPAAMAGAAIADAVVGAWRPHAVLDVGCATGELLEALRQRGVGRVVGLEYSSCAVEVCRGKGLEVEQFDIENDEWSGGSFDVVVSTEVAEHLPERCADRYLDLLAAAAPKVVFTAATPGQGGTDHVNEQPHAYWIERFEKRGFGLDGDLSASWQAGLAAANVPHWYTDNMMVFCRVGDPC